MPSPHLFYGETEHKKPNQVDGRLLLNASEIPGYGCLAAIGLVDYAEGVCRYSCLARLFEELPPFGWTTYIQEPFISWLT